MAGLGSGMVGSAFSMPVLSAGNHLSFGTPLMTAGDYLVGVGVGGLLGGTINGLVALSNNLSFLTGAPKPAVAQLPPPPALPKPELKLANGGRSELQPMPGSVERATVAPATEKGTYSVYEGVDKSGQTKYVGITKREPQIRFNEHYNAVGTGREQLQYRVIDGVNTIDKTGAKIMEQNLINQHGMMKNGGMLLNQRNSIAPQYWQQYGIK